MDLGIGTRQHFRAAVGGLTLVNVNLDDLVAEPVGKPPDIGHFAHGQNELCVPSTLAYREVGGIPQTSAVGRVEIGRQRVDVVTIARFVADGVIQFEQRDPLLKVGQHHFGRGGRCHFGIHTVAVGE